MDEQRQDGQLEPTYSNSVPIRDVALRMTCQKQWTIERGGERGSGISVLMVRHDDDDDDDKKIAQEKVKFLFSNFRHPGKDCW